ncbi:SDR family oxidoreductase [Nonomuraea sp. NN258]|uniref:SDR family NAD(P)-dependent oxidoreductase n=1 Tax=Nonomuraea antri TaxID=2730852 RepID=UPI00156A49A4|nr:SDR family oxidoreductase [Nonomuraea antri]NRQ37771.1 SDR family oxidoreductase [Nonomuraea antri]
MSDARVVVVTGGGTGIGRAIAHRFAAEDADVVIVGRRAAPLDEVAASGRADQIRPVVADVSVPADIARLSAQVNDWYGRVDVLVNNAGYLLPVTLADPASGGPALAEMLDTHLIGPYRLTAALSPMLTRPGGRVINIASIAAVTGGSGAGAAQGYAAAKAGLIGLTFGMARELGPQGVTVNAVAPGFVEDTEFTADFSQERVAFLVGQTVTGRAGTPADVAAAVGYLAGDQAGWVTGQVLHVNGGSIFGR